MIVVDRTATPTLPRDVIGVAPCILANIARIAAQELAVVSSQLAAPVHAVRWMQRWLEEVFLGSAYPRDAASLQLLVYCMTDRIDPSKLPGLAALIQEIRTICEALGQITEDPNRVVASRVDTMQQFCLDISRLAEAQNPRTVSNLMTSA